MAKATLETLTKYVGDEFAEETRSADDATITGLVLLFSKEAEDQIQAKKDNPKIAELAADKKALADGYNNLIKEYKTKIKYLMSLLESRGKL